MATVVGIEPLLRPWQESPNIGSHCFASQRTRARIPCGCVVIKIHLPCAFALACAHAFVSPLLLLSTLCAKPMARCSAHSPPPS